ncbi:MAG: 50S ribosomal protein L4 [Chloroflexota bacterium]|nr:MAG: 50S ribosomal protein L4 [Chloroflexota bacterium]
MKVNVRNTSGSTVEELELSDDIFGIEPNTAVMHQALVRQLANQRLGTHKAKTRGEVSRTTAKWYRQKGTGRARHGSRKSPIFVGGGQAHKPVPRDYTQKMPRKMRRLALRSALSAKAAAEQLIVLDKLAFDGPKTVEVLQLLDNLQISGSAVILLPERNENVEKSARNLENVKTLRAGYLNIRDLLGHNFVIMSKDAVTQIESFLG